jgi:AcrR family transcriptional regulator
MPNRQPLSDVSQQPPARREWRPGSAHPTREQATARVADYQRQRLLKAALGVAAESGYGAMSATAVVTRAGVSRKTFYDLFADRDECFLAALDEALMQMAAAVAPAWEQEGKWSKRLREALIAALRFLDDEREAGEPVISYLVGCGPKSAELRLQVLELLREAVEEGCSQEKALAADDGAREPFDVDDCAALSRSRGGWQGAQPSDAHGSRVAAKAPERSATQVEDAAHLPHCPSLGGHRWFPRCQ